MFTIALSVDIVKYLQNKKEMKVDEIAKAMDTTSEYIQEVIDRKSPLNGDNLKSYLKNTDTKLWKFACEGELLKHFPDRIKKKVTLCKEIEKHLKKRRI